MNRLDYDGQEWIGALHNEHEVFCVRMSDKTFQRHLNAYLERLGVSTKTYLELLNYAQEVSEQRYQAGQHLANLEYWRHCDDPEVRLYHLISDHSLDRNTRT